MKTLLIPLIFLISCGKNTTKTIYKENPFDNSQNEERLRDLEHKVSAMELNHVKLVDELNLLDTNTALIQNAINEMTLDIIQVSNKLDSLEVFEAIIDPCGDGPGFDEVIIKTTKGRLIVYFEDGGKRFLTILTAGSYRTTDRQSCFFSVDAMGNIR